MTDKIKKIKSLFVVKSSVIRKLIIIFCTVSFFSQAAQKCNNNINSTTPTNRFIVNFNNTITDKATGLIWMRCSLGQTGAGCNIGYPKRYNWATALNEIANNYSHWRLPNIKELASIVERQCEKPAVNTEVFPNTLYDWAYWSSTPHVYYTNNAWSINFKNGLDNGDTHKGSSYYIRLVRNTF